MRQDNDDSNIDGPECKRSFDENTAQTYALTPNEWRYLYGISSKSDEKQIKKKADQTAERVHNTIEDLVALHCTDTVAEEIDWGTIWKELIDLPQRPTSRHIEEGLISSIYRTADQERKFAMELGRVISFLCESADGSKSMVLQGFIRGLLIDEEEVIRNSDIDFKPGRRENVAIGSKNDVLKAEGDDPLESIPDIVSEIRSNMQKQAVVAAQEKKMNADIETANLFPASCITAALKEYDITPTETITETISDRMGIEPTLGTRSDEERVDILEQAIKAVADLNNDPKVLAVENLATQLSEDMQALRNERRAGDSGWLVFRDIATGENTVSSDTKTEPSQASSDQATERGTVSSATLSSDPRNQASVTYILRKLSGQKDPKDRWLRGQQWADRPVIEEVTDESWDTTEYGDLIYTIARKATSMRPDDELGRNEVMDQLHSHLFDDEVTFPYVDEFINSTDIAEETSPPDFLEKLHHRNEILTKAFSPEYREKTEK
jgi:hypothetical protein